MEMHYHHYYLQLNNILRKCTAGYKLSKSREKINYLMYIDDVKLFAKNGKELETLIPTVKIYSQDIGMEFGIEKCALLVIRSGKRHITEGVELPNQVVIGTLGEKETYKCLGILEADTMKQQEMKENFFKRVSQKNQKISRDKTLLQEPYQRDKYLGSPLQKILGTILEVDQRRT